MNVCSSRDHVFLLIQLLFLCLAPVLAQGGKASPTGPFRLITIISEPNATVWIDGVHYGNTGTSGKLSIKTISPGRHSIRVRADGFSETTKPLAATQEGDISIPLAKTTDEAELTFQEAERLSSTDREKAEAAYRKAIGLKPRFLNAHIGLVRLLLAAGKHEAAQKALRELKKVSPVNAEASAIEGRLHKELDEEALAVAAFKRSITQGKGFQPEAYTGLGLLYQEKAENLGGEADYARESAAYAEAAKHLIVAVKQLSGAPDAIVVYQLLGLVYERQKKFREAIAVYEEFLQVFPDNNEAEAVRSFIVQIKKQMAWQ